jgi:hypothetical protein
MQKTHEGFRVHGTVSLLRDRKPVLTDKWVASITDERELIPTAAGQPAEPIAMPARNTRTPPSTTWKMAERSGVSM